MLMPTNPTSYCSSLRKQRMGLCCTKPGEQLNRHTMEMLIPENETSHIIYAGIEVWLGGINVFSSCYIVDGIGISAEHVGHVALVILWQNYSWK